MSLGAQMKVIEVALRANVSQYTAGLGMAAAQTKAFGRDIRGLGDELTGAGKTSKQQLNELSMGAMLVGGAMLAGFGIAAGAAMEFNAEMSNVQAATGATGAELDKLRQQAMDAGAATVFSATEAAAAQVELAKAGVSTADIMGGALTGSLDLAAAAGLGVARSAEIGAQAMTIWNLQGSEMSHIADVLAAGANKSTADVDQLAQAVAQGGLIAAQTGLSFEETTGILAMFSDNALMGSDAGTSLKTMLQRLVPTSGEAKSMMDSLGLSFYDANGQFVGMEEVAAQLHARLGGLSDEQRNLAVQTIFGSDAARAANIIIDEGAEGLGEWAAQLDESGYASEQARIKTDNLRGDIERLGGAFQSSLIEAGTEADGVLRFMAQSTEGLVTGMASLPGPVMAVGTGFAGLAGAGLVAVGVVGTLAPKLRESLTVLEGMGPAGSKAASGIAKYGKAAGAATLATVALTLAWAHYQGEIDKAVSGGMAAVNDALADTTSLEAYERQLGEVANQQRIVNEEVGNFWTTPTQDADYRESNRRMGEGLGVLRIQMAMVSAEAKALAAATGDSVDTVFQWLEAQRQGGTIFSTAQEALEAYLAAVGRGEVVQDNAASRQQQANQAADEQRANMVGLQSSFLGVVDAGRSYESALVAIGDAQLQAARAARAVSEAQYRLQEATRGVTNAQQRYQDSFRGVADAQERYEDSLRGVEEAQMAVAEAQQRLDDAMRGPTEDDTLSLEAAEIRLEEARRRMAEGGFEDDLDERRAALDLRRAEIDLARIQEEIAARPAEAAEELADAQDRLNDANSAVEDSLYGIEQAQRAVEDAAHGVAQAQRAVADASYAVTDAQAAAAQAAAGVAAAQDNAVRAAIDLRNKQVDLAAAMRDEKGSARELLDEMLFLQGMYPGLAGAMQPYIDQIRVLLALKEASSRITPAGVFAGLNPFGGGRAAGGPMMAGSTYLTGENGPELITMGTNGMAYAAGSPQTQYAMGSGGGGGGAQVMHITREFNVTVKVETLVDDKRELAREIREEIRILERSTVGQD